MNILEATAILSLLGAPINAPNYHSVALPFECRVTKAPIINVRPVTKEIQYDVSKTSAELSQLGSNTISPWLNLSHIVV